MTPKVPNLEYAPPPKRRTRWHRRVRRWVPLAVAALIAWQYGPPAYHGGRFAYFQWLCGRYEAPPTTVACDEPGRWGGATPPFLSAATDPDPLAELARLWPAAYGGPRGPATPLFFPATPGGGVLLFLHWRTSAGGRERLVILRRVSPALRQSWDAPLAFQAAAVPRLRPWADGGHWPHERPALLPEVIPQAYTDDPTKVAVRFYAGQPDPADASRFTIGFEVEGQPGTVDGQLVDAPDEPGGVRVELKAR